MNDDMASTNVCDVPVVCTDTIASYAGGTSASAASPDEFMANTIDDDVVFTVVVSHGGDGN